MVRLSRLRGFKDLVFDAVEDTTNLVERTHGAVARRVLRRYAPIEPIATPAAAVVEVEQGIAAGVYATIRGVNRSIQKLTELGTAAAEAALPAGEPPVLAAPLRSDAVGSVAWLVDHAEGVVNGVMGDRLSRRGNALDLGMTLRHDGAPLPLERDALERELGDATSKVCVFVHGLGCTEWSWSLSAERHHGDPRVTYGMLLNRDLGYTPLYVRYNSGRHVSENGRLLSELLEGLYSVYPRKLEQIALIGHSMGGLVVRSAAHYGRREERAWSKQLRHVFCLASPHHGAPLETGVHLLSRVLAAFDTAGTQVPAEILEARSAGIKDLRWGYTLDEEWASEDSTLLFADNRQAVSLLDDVGYYYLAATLVKDPAHPLGSLLGDLLVRVASASGDCPEPTRRIQFRSGEILRGLHHFHLANHPEVYAIIRRCLEAEAEGASASALVQCLEEQADG